MDKSTIYSRNVGEHKHIFKQNKQNPFYIE